MHILLFKPDQDVTIQFSGDSKAGITITYQKVIGAWLCCIASQNRTAGLLPQSVKPTGNYHPSRKEQKNIDGQVMRICGTIPPLLTLRGHKIYFVWRLKHICLGTFTTHWVMKFYNLEQIHMSDPAVWAGSHSALLCSFNIGSSIKTKLTNHWQYEHLYNSKKQWSNYKLQYVISELIFSIFERSKKIWQEN